MQNIKDLPLFVKLCFAIIIGALVLAGFIDKPKLDMSKISGEKPSQDAAKDLVDIGIIVQSEVQKIPLKDVEITFDSKGPPETRKTDTAGFAQVSIPVRDDIAITLRKKGFEVETHTLKLSNDPNRTRTYYLKNQKF